MRNKIPIQFVCILILFLSSCNDGLNSPNANNEVPIKFTDANGREVSSWNKEIKLSLPDIVTNTMKFGSTVDVEIDNLSENKISFPKGYNLKIINLTNEEKEIPNSTNYFGPNLTLESKNIKVGSNSLIGFDPKINETSNQKLRIFIIGEMQYADPQKNQLVGAYMDIIMHP